LYAIVEIVAEPSNAGFSLLRRLRKFHIMLRKARARFIADVQTVYNGVQQAVVKHSYKLSPTACLLASAGDLLVEENYVRSLRRLQPLASPPETIYWTYFLTSLQKQYLADCVTVWRRETGHDPSQDMDCILNLGDNPKHRISSSFPSRKIPTFKWTAGVYWVPFRRRWILSQEKAASMGFPTYRQLATVSGCAVEGDLHSGPGAASRVGNSAHVANYGVVIGVALACTQRLPS